MHARNIEFLDGPEARAARALDVAVVTLDQRLARAIRPLGVETVVPAA